MRNKKKQCNKISYYSPTRLPQKEVEEAYSKIYTLQKKEKLQ